MEDKKTQKKELDLSKLDFEEAVKSLLETPPPKKSPKRNAQNKSSKKSKK